MTVGESTLAALCQPPYSVYGAVPGILFLFSSRSSATCHIGLLSPVTLFLFYLKKITNMIYAIFVDFFYRKNAIFFLLSKNYLI